MTLPSKEILADQFITVIQDWLTVCQCQEIDKLNRLETSPLVCHTHDYCDANEAMDQALTACGVETDTQKEEQRQLWNGAWEIAKKTGFAKLKRSELATMVSQAMFELFRHVGDFVDLESGDVTPDQNIVTNRIEAELLDVLEDYIIQNS